MSKRKAAEIDANVENTREIKKNALEVKIWFFYSLPLHCVVDFVRGVTFAIQKYVHQKKPMQSEQKLAQSTNKLDMDSI